MSDPDGNGQGGACARWDIPQIDTVASAGDGGNSRQQGYEDGFAQGRQEALADARSKLEAQVGYLQQLMQALATPFEELDEAVETALLSLAMQISSQVLRHELTVQPEQVLQIVREVVRSLPVASRQVALRLHPDDAALVNEHMAAQVDENAWRIEADGALSRGGCVVTSEHSRIDATLETQLARIAESVLGTAGEEADQS